MYHRVRKVQDRTVVTVRRMLLAHLEQFDGIVIDPVIVAQGVMEFERHVSTEM